MTDIFISYSRTDRARIEPLAAALAAAGFDVWWDKDLKGGAHFTSETEARARAAKVIVVAWSEASIASMWVADEATIGRDDRKLVPICIDDVMPPIGFRQIQTIGFQDWDATHDAEPFDRLTSAVETLAGKNSASPIPPPPSSRSPSIPGGLKPVHLIAIAGLAAIALLVGGGVLFTGTTADNKGDAATMQARAGKSIAVLPFEALSPNENDDFFGRGISEELTNTLAKLPELQVAGRASSSSIDAADNAFTDIGEQLGVSYLLRGSVRRSGDQFRITAQLIGAETGAQLWSRTYEEAASDLFAIEDEIVTDIARTLEIRLGVGVGSLRAPADNVSPEAYEYYLRGLDAWSQRMTTDSARADAVAAFEQAVALEPTFAGAWNALGSSLLFSVGSPLARDREAYKERIETALAKAIETDPESIDAHANLVTWYSTNQIDLGKARDHLAKVRALRGERNLGSWAEATYAAVTGDVETAIRAYQRTIANDPLNYSGRRAVAAFHDEIGQPEESFSFYRECHAARCLAEGFYAYVMLAAIFGGDPDRIGEWRPAYENFEAEVKKLPASVLPPVAPLVQAVVSIELDRLDKDDEINRIRRIFAEDLITDSPGMWAPTFAGVLAPETIIAALHLAYVRGDLFGTPYALSPYYGANPYPDAILRHPDYHALWERPGMAELAALRRANGFTDGLPIDAE